MNKRHIALILAVTLLLAACGKTVYRDAAGNKVERQGDTVTVKTEDGNATIKTGGGQSWPKDKMGDLPELKGNILGVVDTPQGTSVNFTEVSKADFDAYIVKVKAQGFEAVQEMEMEGMSMFMGQKDEATVSAQFHPDKGKNTGSCIIIYGASL